MKMKKILSLALAGVMVLSLAACGGSSGTSSSSSDAAADTAADSGSASAEGGTLQINIWDNNQLAGLQEIADEWSKTSGVTAKINVVDWDNY